MAHGGNRSEGMGGTTPYHGKPGEIIDLARVDVFRGGSDVTVRPGEVKIGRDGLVQPIRGLSVDTDPANLVRFGSARRIVSIPDELQIIQRGLRATHFEVVPKQPMSLQDFQRFVNAIVLA